MKSVPSTFSTFKFAQMLKRKCMLNMWLLCWVEKQSSQAGRNKLGHGLKDSECRQVALRAFFNVN